MFSRNIGPLSISLIINRLPPALPCKSLSFFDCSLIGRPDIGRPFPRIWEVLANGLPFATGDSVVTSLLVNALSLIAIPLGQAGTA